MRKRRAVVLFLAVATSACAARQASPEPAPPRPPTMGPNGYVSDDAIRSKSIADIQRTRDVLIDVVWGRSGFPAHRLPDEIRRGIKSPVANLQNLQRVDELVIRMDAGERTIAHHFIPEKGKDRLVVVHQGHACTLNDPIETDGWDYGVARAIRAIVQAGYSVLGMYMPHFIPDLCEDWRKVHHIHDRLFKDLRPKDGSVMKFFLEPITVSLNYLRTKNAADGFPRYRDYSFVGLSGGGWAATVYPALDPTIRISIPIAGTAPLFMQRPGECDGEQAMPAFFGVAGYLDLYVMGAAGAGRRQVQILNRKDDCCYGEKQFVGPGPAWDSAVRENEARVQRALADIGPGSFRLFIDEAAPKHEISMNAVTTVILPELAREPP